MSTTSKVYMIATPLGNLQDITQRALSTLKAVDHFFAEDTRELSKLMEACGIAPGQKKLHSLSNHNMKEAVERAISILESGQDIGFVCDRGTPGISDPGHLLCRSARERGFAVLPVPGASSVTTLLSVAGTETDRFLFLGFLPLKQKERDNFFDQIRQCDLPACIFESPRRIRATLDELRQAFPLGSVFIGREMTKVFEDYTWHRLADINLDQIPELGEFAFLIVPNESQQKAQSNGWEEEIARRLLPEKEWAKGIAEQYGVSSSDIYNALQQAKRLKS